MLMGYRLLYKREDHPIVLNNQLFGFLALQKSTHLPDMFARLITLVPVAALVAVATAAPNAVGARNGGVSQCNTSDQYCCNSPITQSTQGLSGSLLGVLDGVNLGAGITCSPISVIALPSNGCAQNPVCCTSNNFSVTSEDLEDLEPNHPSDIPH
ncbi:hypothetical protein HD554DRAFT_2169926 [Boletus coccyginus]|nr:hypothetical protein HD554DRAFT_2169926 [Boletus coccyginus]